MTDRRMRLPGAAVVLILSLSAPLFAIAVPPAAIAQVPAPPTQLAPPPPGMARVWFLRQFQPGQGLGTPMIYVNGTPLAASHPGTIFYRDLAPGTYNFSVETCGSDVNQAQTVQLAAGNQAELEIQSLTSFAPPDCPGKEVFYVRPVLPRFLQMYLPQLRNLGAR